MEVRKIIIPGKSAFLLLILISMMLQAHFGATEETYTEITTTTMTMVTTTMPTIKKEIKSTAATVRTAKTATESIDFTIEELCAIFGIPPENCSCEIFDVRDPTIKSLCHTYDRVYNRTVSQLYAALSVIFSLLGVIGNLSVIVVTTCSPKHHTGTCKKLVTSLAASDLMSGRPKQIALLGIFGCLSLQSINPPLLCCLIPTHS